MKIGIIGAGSIGYNIAKKLAPNHEIKLAASKLSEALEAKAASIGVKAVDIREAVKDVEVIILTIPKKAIPELPKDLFDGVPPEVVIADAGNYIPFRDGRFEELDNVKVDSVWVSEQIGRPVIKAFNNILEETLIEEGRPEGDPDRLAISVAGDSKEGKAIISRLINETGFDVVDAGELSESWRQQPGTPAYCTKLNSSELKEALAAAVKEQAPLNREQVMADFQKKNFKITKEEIVETGRSVYGNFRKPRNN
jgi:8-hydroxy-5-deazaflavin:NADPH oxidoreductase